jgi:hypothetical protein
MFTPWDLPCEVLLYTIRKLNIIEKLLHRGTKLSNWGETISLWSSSKIVTPAQAGAGIRGLSAAGGLRNSSKLAKNSEKIVKKVKFVSIRVNSWLKPPPFLA